MDAICRTHTKPSILISELGLCVSVSAKLMEDV